MHAMIQSVNFPISTYSIQPYGNWETLGTKLRALGLDGIEAITDTDNPDPTFDPDLVSGYHLTFYPDWLDFWRQDEEALRRKFGTRAVAEAFYRARTPEELLRRFREDLFFGLRFRPPYIVFHVSDVSLEESMTYRWLHTDREVLDGAIELINLLLKDVEPAFDFLVENLWWPGFTFTDPKLTEYLLSGIEYPRVGIMLDTGHLMNANTEIRNQKDGVRWILENWEKHGALKQHVYGIHFHQSLSGAYVRSHTGAQSSAFTGDYFHDFSVNYPHIQMIDRHRPWTAPECVRILETVCPKYLTHELSTPTRGTQLGAVRRQINTIRRGNRNQVFFQTAALRSLKSSANGSI